MKQANLDTLQQEVPNELLLACETGNGKCDTIKVVRQQLQQPVKVIFPNGGTETEIRLFDTSSFAKYINRFPETDNNLFIRRDHTFMDRKPSLDMSNLADGNYVVHMTACEVGGFYKLELKTQGR
ncbi:hypothetical protein HRH25_23795 [Flavisolibacter sp. BT320]|nr:hypothetical protein [Flavisolibacter longurius]